MLLACTCKLVLMIINQLSISCDHGLMNSRICGIKGGCFEKGFQNSFNFKVKEIAYLHHIEADACGVEVL